MIRVHAVAGKNIKNVMENKIVIENPKGSYKSFEIKNDPLWKDYPITGVTYPVDYGYIKGYKSEDGHDLDVFVGSGELNGYIKIWRCDVPIETKVIMHVTEKEWDEIVNIFSKVIKDKKLFNKDSEFEEFLSLYEK